MSHPIDPVHEIAKALGKAMNERQERLMSDEDYLLQCLRDYREGLMGNLMCLENDDTQPALVSEGMRKAFYQSIGALDACIRLYDLKVQGKIPEELLRKDS